MRIDGPEFAALRPRIPEPPAGAERGINFAERLGDLLRAASEDQRAADTEAQKVAAGTGDGLDAMLALSKADLSLRLVAELRNRGLEAFQEIMRLQV